MWRFRMAVAALPAVVACRTHRAYFDRPPPVPAAALSEPKRLCVSKAPARPCREANEIEAWLSRPDLEIVGDDQAPTGIQGTHVLTLRVPGSPAIVFRAKWRAHETTDHRNSPRHELAAHAVQKLFLSPHEWVVPPSAPHCFALAPYRAAVDARARATFPEAPGCVYGVLQYWLEDVQSLPDADDAGWFDFGDRSILDQDLFEKNAVYREAMCAVNLLTYLIEHADSHTKQFLLSKDRERPVLYSVDNSMAFGARHNSKLREDWADLRVKRLPRRMVERLRAASQHTDALAAIADLERQGEVLAVVPTSDRPGAFGNHGFEWVDGRLRVRLTAEEVAALQGRLTQLLERVDRGEIQLDD